MRRLHRLLRDAWAMAAPYWRPEERWVARALLVSAVGLNLGMSTSTSCSTSGTMRCRTRTLRGVRPAARPRRDDEGGHHGAVELRYVSTGADAGRAARTARRTPRHRRAARRHRRAGRAARCARHRQRDLRPHRPAHPHPPADAGGRRLTTAAARPGNRRRSFHRADGKLPRRFDEETQRRGASRTAGEVEEVTGDDRRVALEHDFKPSLA